MLGYLGLNWHSWNLCKSKLIVPTLDHITSVKDEFSKEPPTIRWKRKRPPLPASKKHLHTLLLAITANLCDSHAFALGTDLGFRKHLRAYRGLGSLETSKLNDHDISVLQRHLRTSGQHFKDITQNNPHAFTCIVDSGCSYSATNTFSDVEPSTIRKLNAPISLGGIAGGLTIDYIGTANWETLDDKGNVIPFVEDVLIHTDLPDRLLSPQAFLSRRRNGEKFGEIEDHFRVSHNKAEWHMDGKKLLTLNFDSAFLPRMVLFSKGESMDSLKAMSSVLHSSNQNLSAAQKIWLRWHIKLGHLSFSHVQKLALGGLLDVAAMGLSRTKAADAPKCTACQYGKQVRIPDHSTTTTKNASSEGALKMDQLSPGDRVFCDHLESKVKGRLLHTAGREQPQNRFCGSMIFCDASSGYIHIEHQVSLNATDTINAKDKFERLAQDYGVQVDKYHTDNGVFKSQRFVQEITNNVQSIRYSGVGAKWQNGVAEGGIRIVVTKARTMMLHASLNWPEMDDPSLWPLAVSHAAYLYNHTPNEASGIAPIEIFSRTVGDGQALRTSQPWGCPAYVLEPRLTEAGGKIPKWQPRSRRAQFVGMSPLHAESVGLVRNLKTGYISPQYHIVYDSNFETVYSSDAADPPMEWEHLCTFQRFETHFEHDHPPLLSDEWLTPEEIVQNQSKRRAQQLRQGRRTAQDLNSKEARDDFQFEAPNSRTPLPPETPLRPTRELPGSLPRESPSVPPREPDQPWSRDIPISPVPSSPSQTPSTSGPRRSSRTRRPPPENVMNFDPQLKSYAPSSLIAMVIDRACGGLSPPSGRLLQAQVMGYDPLTGFQENLHPATIQSPLAMKAKASKDPDLPSLQESLNGPHSEQFWKAMDAEIASLESKGTWTIVDRSSMPLGMKAVPGTWVQRIKRLPNGELNKFKSRWCCRGDLQDYEGIPYSPLVGWPTVRAGLLLASAHGWKSRQVDFTLAFCQSPQPKDDPLFMELPQYYRPKGYEGRDVVLQLNKSIYGQVDSPKLFYEHLCKGMDALGFKPSESDPCLFIHSEKQIMVLNYCDDQIWLSPDNNLIEEYVNKLQNLGYDLTLEEDGDIYGFLGINFQKKGLQIELTQTGLIEKVIKFTGMEGASSKSTPAAQEPLGSDVMGAPFDEEWGYPAAVGMLLYISSNTRPDIQFAVHQVARFSHNPKKSHGQALKRIVRYLIETRDRGLLFQPDLTKGLDCWVDADFCGLYGYEDEQDPVSVRSRTGFSLTLFGCPIIWSSKLQSEITLSSTAAEYVAFSMAMRELLPMRALLHELGTKLDLPVMKQSLVRSTVFEDNQGCLSLVNVPKMSPRNKYLALKYHFFRSEIGEAKGVIAKYVPTLEQRADILTKGLPPTQFAVIRKLLMGW